MVWRTAAALAVVSGVALAGCGGSDSDDNGVAGLGVEEILAEAQEAVDAAESAHFVGAWTLDGEAMDLDVTFGPDSGVGTLGSGGVELEITLVDGNAYLHGGTDFWTQVGGEALSPMLSGKYVEIPADDPAFGEFTQFLDLGVMSSQLLESDGELTKGEETDIDGEPVIALVDEDGSTLYIATTGEPLPVQITSPEGESGVLDLEWGIDVDVTAPDEEDVVDPTELMQ